MSTASITLNDSGELVLPNTDGEWDAWVSASSTRNYVLDDPLIDWLERHGKTRGFSPDGEASYDERTDFLTFIFRKGNEFETAVVNHLRTMVEVRSILGDGD